MEPCPGLLGGAIEANREAIRTLVQPQTTIWQYTHGAPDETRVSPVRYSQVRIEDGIEVVASDRLAGRLGMVRRS